MGCFPSKDPSTETIAVAPAPAKRAVTPPGVLKHTNGGRQINGHKSVTVDTGAQHINGNGHTGVNGNGPINGNNIGAIINTNGAHGTPDAGSIKSANFPRTSASDVDFALSSEDEEGDAGWSPDQQQRGRHQSTRSMDR